MFAVIRDASVTQLMSLSDARRLPAGSWRSSSAIAHPSLMGLDFVTVDLSDGGKRVQLEERDPEMRGPFGLGPILFACSLYIAGQTLRWPDVDVDAAFQLMPGL